MSAANVGAWWLVEAYAQRAKRSGARSRGDFRRKARAEGVNAPESRRAWGAFLHISSVRGAPSYKSRACVGRLPTNLERAWGAFLHISSVRGAPSYTSRACVRRLPTHLERPGDRYRNGSVPAPNASLVEPRGRRYAVTARTESRAPRGGRPRGAHARLDGFRLGLGPAPDAITTRGSREGREPLLPRDPLARRPSERVDDRVDGHEGRPRAAAVGPHDRGDQGIVDASHAAPLPREVGGDHEEVFDRERIERVSRRAVRTREACPRRCDARADEQRRCLRPRRRAGKTMAP